MALSADGNTALIGGWNDDSVAFGDRDYSGKGAAWVFTRTAGVWSQQGPKLTPTDEVGDEPDNENGKFGTIVALSADGNTALIGAWNDDTSRGAAWVFTRSSGAWSQQGPKLTPTGEVGEGRFGRPRRFFARRQHGADRSALRQQRQGRGLGVQTLGLDMVSAGGQAGPAATRLVKAEFGTNVALSADGATALSGGWRDNGGTGASWVFLDPPSATTGTATGVGETGATLNGRSRRRRHALGVLPIRRRPTPTALPPPPRASGPPAPASTLDAAIAGLEPGTAYHFRLVVENSGGVAYGYRSDIFEQTQSRAPSRKATNLLRRHHHLPGRPPLLHLRQSAAKWRLGNRLARISRAKTPTGTTFSFSLNEPAAVTFSFTRRVGGRTKTAGTLTFTGHGGTNRVAFQGRIAPARKLKPGRYKQTLDIGHQPRRSALCAEVAELHDREVAAPIPTAREVDPRLSAGGGGQAGEATSWAATSASTHSPATCLVAALIRFQTLITAIESTSAASCSSS